MKAPPLILSVLAAALVSGCATRYSAYWVGRTGDYSEVYTGEQHGVADLSVLFDKKTKTVALTGIYTGIVCSLEYIGGFGTIPATLHCPDGRIAQITATPPGTWAGTFDNGVNVELTWVDSPTTAGSKLAQYKAIADSRHPGRQPHAAAQQTAVPPSPQSVAQRPPAVTPPSAAQAPVMQAPALPARPVVNRFPRGTERPDDIAVIIGNGDYGRLGKDIPDVRPAHADAEGARLYATQALGIKEGNVIVLKDATGSQLTRVFGAKDNHQGQLFDWVKPGKSRVYVYYSGHGAPASQGGSPYLVPTDADAARIELNGYPVKQLYDNLGKLPAESVTVVLEACFSGISPAGSVLSSASPVFFEVKAPPVPANLTVIAAGAANQMASWEIDGTSSLFTKYYLQAMTGEADADKDGRVTLDELERYLKDTLTYYARRHYGRDQQAQIVKGGGR